jgi:hypothetical protein
MSDIFDSFFADEAPLPTLDMQDAFRLLDQVIPKNSSLVAIKCVKITGDDKYLTFEGTDLDYGVKVRTVNFLKFQGVSIVNWSHFKSHFGAVALKDMDSLAADDYPRLPNPDGTEIGTNWLDAGRKVAYCVSRDRTRLALNGLYVHQDGVVATDGHRLHLVHGAHDTDMIVPPKLLKLAKKAPTKCLVSNNAITNFVALVYPWGYIASKTIEGPYPNYKQVIPRESSLKILVPVAQLRETAKKAVDMRRDGGRVSLHHKAIWAMDNDGKWHQIASLPTLPGGIVAQFNGGYVIESLNGLAGTLTSGYRGPIQAMVLNPDNREETRILMPLRPEGVE